MIVLISIAIICLIIQIWHWHFVFRNATRDIPVVRMDSSDWPFVSVVVCFHRKWTTIPGVIRHLSGQSEKDFELILVNDGPVEIDARLLEKAIAGIDHIRYITHSKTRPGKKGALAAGIRAAQSEWIMVTDIDCLPGPDWIKSFSKYIPAEPAIVLGFSPYQRRPGLLNFIVLQETLLTAFQYMGWALAGQAYMGVGRNMVSHRSIYEAYPLEDHQHIPTGDDDLFVNAAAQDYPVHICNDPDSFVYSNPPATWKAWYRQKTRHKSGGKYYSTSSKIRLGVFMSAMVLEKILWVVLAFGRFELFLILFVLKILGTITPLRELYRHYSFENDFWKMWLYEWFHTVYLILVMPYILFKSRMQWD